MNEYIQMHDIRKEIFQGQYCANSSLWLGTAQHDKSFVRFCSYKTEEALQVESQSKSNLYGSARRGTNYKTGLNFLRIGCFLKTVNERLIVICMSFRSSSLDAGKFGNGCVSNVI